MSDFENKVFAWDFTMLRRFYDKYIVKWLNSAMGWTEEQKAQARENLGVAGAENAVQEVETAESETAAGYLVDKNKKVLATLNRDGSVDWTVMNACEKELNNTISLIKGGHSLADIQGKKVSILGASIDTFYPESYGYDKDSNLVRGDRYPGSLSDNVGRRNDVLNIDQTWWMQVIKRCGASLERNNSIGSSSISLRSEGFEGTEGTGRPCYLRRYDDLGNPDVIFIHGLGNEPTETSTYVFKPELEFNAAVFDAGYTADRANYLDNSSNWQGFDLMDLCQSYDVLIRLLHYKYPNARLVHIIGHNTAPKKVTEAIKVLEYYGEEYVNLREVKDFVTTIGTEQVSDAAHPDAAGMNVYADYILKGLEGFFEVEKSVENLAENLDELSTKAVTEVEFPLDDENVSMYITDTKKRVIAVISKDGAINRLVDSERDKAVSQRLEDVDAELEYVSKEIPDNGNNVIKYLVGSNRRVVGTIDTQGRVSFLAGGGFAGEETSELNIDGNIVKAVTDSKGRVIGYIDSDGNVNIESLSAKSLSVNGNADVSMLIALLAGKNSMHELIGDRTYAILDNITQDYHKGGIPKHTEPCISITDDDAIDNQIPSSRNRTEPTETQQKLGGFCSYYYPMFKSLSERYANSLKGRLTLSIAVEGQRVGLTAFDATDEHDALLNANGQMLNALSEKAGWESLCHSMTARYMAENYLVNGVYNSATGEISDTLANGILAKGYWNGQTSWRTTTAYNAYDGKNYIIRQDKSGWDILPDKLIKPYMIVLDSADDINGNATPNVYGTTRVPASKLKLRINPSYTEAYQVGEWYKRADELGLIRPADYRLLVSWGSSASIHYYRERMKYADVCTDSATGYRVNTIPMTSNICRSRMDPLPSDSSLPNTDNEDYYNVYTAVGYKRLKGYIDECIDKGGWLVLSGHVYENTWYNGYHPEYLDYTDKGNLYGVPKSEHTGDTLDYYDAGYPSEWEVPLKYTEIAAMDENNYWEVPPARLGISSWSEWYPCPGTGLAMVWDALIYAISKGVEFVSTTEGLRRFGNIVSIGYQGDSSQTHADMYLIEHKADEYKASCIMGADYSITIKSN